MHKNVWAVLTAAMLCLAFVPAARCQSFYFVDCSGATPGYYTSIGAALAVAGPNSYVFVTPGACNESVYITNAFNINLGALFGSITINGKVSVGGSDTVFLYGLNVTNPYGGDAFDITSSHNVMLVACSGNGNSRRGMTVNTMSDVTLTGPGSFDGNGGGGINLSQNSLLNINNWNGSSFDISGNTGPGVWLSGGWFGTLGTTTINNNVNPSGTTPPTGYGIQALGASKVQIGTCYGNNQIADNQNGGIDAEENTELSLWSCGNPSYQSFVTANGPVGISAGLGSQVTLYDNAQISGHSGPGVELYGNSQLRVFSANLISQNGSASDPRSAGIVVDGNSEAYLRGGTITMNQGPGILVLVNSSADSLGATFSDNSRGSLTCDSSAYAVSDLLPPAGNACREPHHLGNRRGLTATPLVKPDSTALKNKLAQYKAFASRKK